MTCLRLVLLWLAPLNLLLNGVVSSLLVLLHLVTMDDLLRVQEGGLGWFHEVVGDLHGGTFLILFVGLLFIGGMRQFGVGGVGFREDPLVRPYRWFRPDLVPPSSLFAV